ncbi:GGDEF domain-containing protein [Pectinatus haikarae]|uniref:Diguanylate cyclase (GGDEF)-like protein n=1 Tax=Pectinatus haikarae TaxID=349096 RepID=A0ABT9Y504_9FIRM|nr:bifunctional diguanylate cyclase/phosphodiesterase [Pectinatus haikarae]MDQ0202907.1 diguanylate cyclase (GGDEF)-like protein [Pectinatus haikarae]
MNESGELKMILENKLITPVYQPIVALKNGEIFAYEALSRGPEGSPLHPPDALFALAEKEKCLWHLDYLCRSLAIKNVENILGSRKLFLNVDARILYDRNFHQGSTAKFLQQCNLNERDIVFEISEKTTVDDYKSFCAVLENYQCQNYKIAIDDVGAGYSGLNLLAQIAPQFIKLDIGLVKDIDKNHIRKSIVKALVGFAHSANIKIIAEGIERKEELNILIELGVDYGQGFFLGRPKPELLELEESIVCYIREVNREKENFRLNTLLNMTIGEIASKQTTFSSETMGHVILDYLRSMQEPLDVIIVDEGIPAGILNYNMFYQHLATKYGISLYSNRPIRLLMNNKPLIVDYETSIEETSQQVLNRQNGCTYDAIIVVKDSKYYGTVTIKKLLEVTTKLEINRARHANPLTGLPGNNVIEWTLAAYLEKFIPFAVIYIDIDNFKVYNDVYGFESGDTVLIATARLLHETLNKYTKKFFLGHIGGDDFIAFIPADEISEVCNMLIKNFDMESKNFYSAKHRMEKYIAAANRNGQIEKFPLMTVSLAVLRITGKDGLTSTILASKAAAVKKKCKAIHASTFIINDYGNMNLKLPQ